MGTVRPSKLPCSSPVLFVPKGHGRGLQLCVDYRGLNKVTIPNRYPLPNMDERRERIRKSRWFTRLDLKNGYHLVRIKPGNEWKTAFRCRYGLYEYTVMPFGLMNAPATIQSIVTGVLSGQPCSYSREGRDRNFPLLSARSNDQILKRNKELIELKDLIT